MAPLRLRFLKIIAARHASDEPQMKKLPDFLDNFRRGNFNTFVCLAWLPPGQMFKTQKGHFLRYINNTIISIHLSLRIGSKYITTLTLIFDNFLSSSRLNSKIKLLIKRITCISVHKMKLLLSLIFKELLVSKGLLALH